MFFNNGSPAIIVGLRGFASYGPIWSGKLGSEAEVKTDEIDEVRRLYPFFLPKTEPKGSPSIPAGGTPQ